MYPELDRLLVVDKLDASIKPSHRRERTSVSSVSDGTDANSADADSSQIDCVEAEIDAALKGPAAESDDDCDTMFDLTEGQFIVPASPFTTELWDPYEHGEEFIERHSDYLARRR